jgi:hypothetical protein
MELAALRARFRVCTLVAGVATADVTTLVWINAVAGLRWLEPQWLTNLWQVLGA